MLSDVGGPSVAGGPAAACGDNVAGFPVLGPENALLRHVLAMPHGLSGRYNPIVFVGRDGCGKAHFLDFIERRWREGGGMRVTRWTGESLVRDVGAALASDQLHRVHQRFVTSELVLLEGLDRVTSTDVLSALPHLLDRAGECGGQVVVTLLNFPAETKGFPPSLSSRLSAGLVVSVRMPETESRRSVVRSIADRLGVSIEDGALARLASADIPTGTIGTSIESLAVSGCTRIEPRHAATIIGGATPSMARPSIRRIISATAKHYGLPTTELLGPSRHRNIANARSTAIYLARRLTGKSLVEIGKCFGGRDHTTVLHSIRITRRRADSDPAWQRDIDELLARLT